MDLSALLWLPASRIGIVMNRARERNGCWRPVSVSVGREAARCAKGLLNSKSRGVSPLWRDRAQGR
jgi:hypothetical protein